ncbi:protein-disulfide reductase DsbD family protein [Desulfovibrio litoralis]|uniref:Thiol:disulfide interchange protein DsbD n=1 Tax=Desulfovibrio litoralis DSM 11393 TaxID=1121455 RepID=A0A1M7THR4_9BACT|nr:cytochrome c biogenesis protein CcdA [Desulfovibrio litoralis]SHN70255.1 thiol:disulfide interchange protein DsbD [Desulfovibrio litoralis DSM 11393]
MFLSSSPSSIKNLIYKVFFISLLFIASQINIIDFSFKTKAAFATSSNPNFTLNWSLTTIPQDFSLLAQIKEPIDPTLPFDSSNKKTHLPAIIVELKLKEGYYFYANNELNQGKPTKTGIIGFSFQPKINKAAVFSFYPPANKKNDLLNPGTKVLSYDQNSNFLLLINQEFSFKINGQESKAEFSGLLCSANNCTPVKEIFSFNHIDFNELPLLTNAEITKLHPNLAKLTLGSSLVQKNNWVPASQTSTAQDASNDPAQANELKKEKAEIQELVSSDDNSSEKNTIVTTEESQAITPIYFNQALEVHSLLKAILLGMLAGFILNFMPCVLPVLSLKLSGLMFYSEYKNKKARLKAFREHCIFFSVGILTWFTILGFVLFKSNLVWGQIFQFPILIMILAALIFALSLSLFNVFNLPLIDLKSHGNHPKLQAFSTGLLATVLATPCSGPLLGGVLGWAFQQGPTTIFIVLISVGFGMSLIYFIFAAFPNLVSKMPKPGNWMLTLAQAVGFLLIGTSLWLLSALPDKRLLSAIVLLLFIAFLCWLWGLLVLPHKKRIVRAFFRVAIISMVVFSFWVWEYVDNIPKANWATFNQTQFEQLLGNEAMMITFTADWCPNCKAVEKTVLTNTRLNRIQANYDINIIKVDLTGPNPEGQALLKELGSSSIPLLAIFPSGKNAHSPIVIRDMFTAKDLNNALEQALGQTQP